MEAVTSGGGKSIHGPNLIAPSKEFLRSKTDMSVTSPIGKKWIMSWRGVKGNVIIKGWNRIYVAKLGVLVMNVWAPLKPVVLVFGNESLREPPKVMGADRSVRHGTSRGVLNIVCGGESISTSRH